MSYISLREVPRCVGSVSVKQPCSAALSHEVHMRGLQHSVTQSSLAVTTPARCRCCWWQLEVVTYMSFQMGVQDVGRIHVLLDILGIGMMLADFYRASSVPHPPYMTFVAVPAYAYQIPGSLKSGVFIDPLKCAIKCLAHLLKVKT